MGSFWESSEVKCAAGVGLSALGIGIALPVVAEACTEAIQDVGEKIVANAEAGRESFRDEICRAHESIPSYAEILFGLSPITTLAVPFTKAVCEETDPVSAMTPDLVFDALSAMLPFGGVAGLLAEGVHQAIRGQVQAEDLLRSFGESLLGGVMLFGATRTLRRVSAEQLKHAIRGTELHYLHFRQFKKLDHHLNPEVLEQLRRIK
ncbi:MAG: hypothetical protein IT572_08665 [Deltaproteobacteria bacterium]|nr:hypothetical protein [Deltaproteobacteria bacterium]